MTNGRPGEGTFGPNAPATRSVTVGAIAPRLPVEELAVAPVAVRVMVVSDHPLVRDGLRSVFTCDSGVRIVADSPGGPGIADAAVRAGADAVVMDLPFHRGSATLAARAIHDRSPHVRVVFLASFVDERLQISTAIAGAYCCLERELNPARLLAALRGAEGSPPPAAQAARPAVERLLRTSERRLRENSGTAAGEGTQLLRLAIAGMTDHELQAALRQRSVEDIQRRLLSLHEWLLGAPAP